ncbi:unnamed protein product [Phytophthora fragariaefolia]|uniref:Unnamed protein product n=1 Tax=Phytophthora fragariaefolia TaxID=1490495 RepID=A0A9W6XWT0_9STRA|nr:unnamed protein product [Phytophthora fragariaefolia]
MCDPVLLLLAVPFKNDAVKNAVLREQMKIDATKMGVPMEVVAATQQQLQHEAEADDPFAKMVNRGAQPAGRSAPAQPSSPEKQKAPPVPAAQQKTADEEEAEAQPQAGGSCAVM